MNQLSKITEIIIKDRYNGEVSNIFNRGGHFSKDEILKLLQDFKTMINNHSDYELIHVSHNAMLSIHEVMNTLIDEHCYLSDNYSVTPDGIIRDGIGFIYAGQTNKLYNIGQKLHKSLSDKITKIVDARWNILDQLLCFLKHIRIIQK